jgi:GNAT superfamily N-acetyltransferase
MSTSEVEVTVVDPAQPGAQYCLREYFAELDRRFDTGYDPAAALPCDPDEMRPPAGVFLLAALKGEPVGCAALKLPTGRPAELKRMWVSPGVRGLGIGRRLLEEAEKRAAESRRTAVRLDSNHALTEAIALYRSAGYVTVAPFNDDPYADEWFEKQLEPPASVPGDREVRTSQEITRK